MQSGFCDLVARVRQRFNLLLAFLLPFSLCFSAFSLVPFEGIWLLLCRYYYHFQLQVDSEFTLLNINPHRLVV